MASGSAFWSCILPSEKTNESENPSWERGTAGAGVIASASLGTTTLFQQFGLYCLQVTPDTNGTSGAILGTFQGTVNLDYSVSAYVHAQTGVPYMIAVADTSNALAGSALFTGGGTWHRYTCAYTEDSSQTRRVIVRKNNSADGGDYRIDGWQVERGSVTTYIDGDADGCIWLGAVHASQSYRGPQVRAGGSVVSLSSLGMIVEESPGIGMPPLENTALSYAVLDGAQFVRQRAAPRVFSLTTTMTGTTWGDFHKTRAKVIDAFKIDLATPQQPTRFWYTGANGTVQLDAVIDSGLEYSAREGFTETTPIRFIAYDPYWEATTQVAKALSSRAAIGSTNFVAQRSPLGVWGTMGKGNTGTSVQAASPNVFALSYSPGGTLFVGGAFGTAGGTQAPNIAMWYKTTSAWGTLAGGTVNSSVFAIAQTPQTRIYVGGIFTTVAGTTAPKAAFWDGAWGTLTGGTIDSGANFEVDALLYSPQGTLFIGGTFGLVAGTTSKGICQWVPGGAFGTLVGQAGGTVDGNVLALAYSPDSRLYIGGVYNKLGGTTAPDIGFWRNNAFGTMNAGANGRVQALKLLPNAQLVAGGVFSTMGGVTAHAIAMWNGQQWAPIGSGLDFGGAAAAAVFALEQVPSNGLLYAGGLIGTAGGLPLTDNVAQAIGNAWTGLDIDLPANGTIYAMARAPDNTLYIGGVFSGTSQAAAVTAVVNSGRAFVAPTFRCRNISGGTIKLWQLVNQTTGDALYFNLSLLAGEEVTLNMAQGSRSFQSSFRGNIFNTILGAGIPPTFGLLPGTNYISFFGDSGSVDAGLYYNPRHWSADGGTVY